MALNDSLLKLVEKSGHNEMTLDLIWAAYDGDEALTKVLDGEPGVGPPAPEVSAGTVPVWLNSISVEGFRGIGPRVDLILNPKPGLTLVVGRNGSGKSSFAEALEALLTGDNQRWRNRPAAWIQGWRNLHHNSTLQVGAEFRREGDSVPCEIIRRWEGTQFADSTQSVTLSGADAKFEWLQWEGPLSTYKPFLSYNELGSFLEQKPSAIYDALAGALGLERLTGAAARLRFARLEAEKPGKELKKTTTSLRATLAPHDDQRAEDAHKLLGARRPDFDAIGRLAALSADAGEADLRRLAQIELPDVANCHAIAEELEKALAEQAAQSVTDAGQAARVAELLNRAVEHHRHEGDSLCPVCRTGRLDASWLEGARLEADELAAQSRGIQAAESAVTSARQKAIRCLVAPLAALSTDRIDTTHAQEAWASWAHQPNDGFTPADLVGRLRSTALLIAAVKPVQAEASEALEQLDQTWKPIAAELSAWVQSARAAELSTQLAKQLSVAEEFFKKAEGVIRQERFAPIAQRSGELWEELRQQSNVSLERVALKGKTTSRSVDLDVTVDGTETSALGVMSQGELHALALALFLPRVTSDESPFRFVLIDDPVQAMDPARVDGLARTLADVAKNRQVVVFTHDDRLPAACRRLSLDAEVIEVSRRARSQVSTEPTYGPAAKALGDARILAKSEKLPPDLRQKVVPVHCRRAVEAAARDRVWAHLLAKGLSHSEIDDRVADTSRATDLLGLLLLENHDGSPGPVYEALKSIEYSLGSTLSLINRAVHDPPADLNPEMLVAGTKKLVAAIEQYQP